MLDLNKVYFVMEMTADDFLIVSSVSKGAKQTPQQFIMEALRTHLIKLQQEALSKEETSAPPAEKKKEGDDK